MSKWFLHSSDKGAQSICLPEQFQCRFIVDGVGNCASAWEEYLDIEEQNWKTEDGDLVLHDPELNCGVH